MILLWGHAGDAPLLAVRNALWARRAAVAFLDQRLFRETSCQLSVAADVTGWLRVGLDRIDLSSVTAAYVRPLPTRRFVTEGEAQNVDAHALVLEDTLTSWCDIAPALIINRPEAMSANSSKPYQLSLIHRAGFLVPPTLVTTDTNAARAFFATHGEVIFKSVSGARSIVSRLGDSDVARLSDLQWCPTQFQAYVAGTDVRVHVVGEEVFACEILSMADDYRYGAVQGLGSAFRAMELPPEVHARCVRMVRDMDLSVAGVDLRRSDAGWFCFEVNPAPGFTFFTEVTGQPVAEAIAALLCGED